MSRRRAGKTDWFGRPLPPAVLEAMAEEGEALDACAAETLELYRVAAFCDEEAELGSTAAAAMLAEVRQRWRQLDVFMYSLGAPA